MPKCDASPESALPEHPKLDDGLLRQLSEHFGDVPFLYWGGKEQGLGKPWVSLIYFLKRRTPRRKGGGDWINWGIYKEWGKKLEVCTRPSPWNLICYVNVVFF